jgi:hypothetical protein
LTVYGFANTNTFLILDEKLSEQELVVFDCNERMFALDRSEGFGREHTRFETTEFRNGKLSILILIMVDDENT